MVVIIEGLEINKFKNIKGKTIDFGDFNIIIGPSNVGKSNILRAISISSKTIGGKIESGHDHRFNCDVCTKIKGEFPKDVEFLGGGYNLEKYDQFKGTGKTGIRYNFNKELIVYNWLNKNRSKIPEIFNYIQNSNPNIKSSQYIGDINQMLNGGLAKFIHSQNDAKEMLLDNFAEYYISFLSNLLRNKEELVSHLKEDVKNSLFTVKLVFNINAIAAEHISVLHEVQEDKKTIFYEIKDNVLYCPESRLNGYKGKTFSEHILRKFTKKDLDRLLDFVGKVVGPRISNAAFNCEDPKTLSFVFDDFETPIDEQGSGLRSLIGPVWGILTAKEGSIVIIDEPELGLHPSAKQEFLKLLLKEAETKQIFIATHDPTFVNPVIWQEFIREKKSEKFSVKVLLYSIYNQTFVNVDLDISKEDPETFAGYLPHTTSLKKAHIYVEGPSDVCIFQIWFEKYLKEKMQENWLKKFNEIGIYHLGGDNWMHLLYTIPRGPYKCMVILDGDKAKAKVNAKEVCGRYNNKAKFENISRFKFCQDIGEIGFDSNLHPIYCLKRKEIEYYFDPVLLTICIVDQSKLDSVPLNKEIKTINELKDVCNDLFSLNETNQGIYEYQQEDRKLVIDLDQKALEIVENGETLLKLQEIDGRVEIEDVEIEEKEIYGLRIADKMSVPDEIRGVFDSILDKTECQRFQNYPISK